MEIRNYILITPCKNEEESLPKLAESVISQTIKPNLWVIVDDGSTDETPDILQNLTSRNKWIESVRLNEKPRDLGIHYSQVCRTGFDYAISYCKNNKLEYNYICSVDADIILESNYFELLIYESEKNENLGICSGSIGNIINGKVIWSDFVDDLPSGGARLWKKKCFEDTGGYLLTCSPDSVSNVKAKIIGWDTRQFKHAKAVSTRAYASAEGQWKGYKKAGANNYFIGYTPIHVLLKGIKLLHSKNGSFRDGVGLAYIHGYFSEYLKGSSRIADSEVLDYYKKNRLKEILCSKVRFRQRNKVVMFTLLIILNVVLRIPSISHEKGTDSFFIHSLANSITGFGHANWWLHWLSVFGYYPYSYASATPFSLSGISQLTGLDMEKTVLLFCIVLGLFSLLTTYLLAGVLYDDFLFKYTMALIFSISPCIMVFTTWELSSRGPFLVFLPFFIYLTIKNMHNVKHAFLLLLPGIFLFSIHHLSIVIIPIILIFIAIQVFSKIATIKNVTIKNKSVYFNYIYTIGLLAVLMSPFFGMGIEVTGSKYNWISDLTITIFRYIGPLAVFALGGFVYLMTRKDKKINIWYFLCISLVFAPYIHDQIYGIYIVQLFLVFFIVVGFRNLLDFKSIKTSTLISVFIISMLLIFTLFSAFYNHYRTGQFKDSWYMDEKTYTAGKWLDQNVNKERKAMCLSENHYNIRLISLQNNGMCLLYGDVLGLIYGHINKDFVNNFEEVPITDSYFYSESPYRMTQRDKFRSIEWYTRK